jgi:hypothetical protein
MTLARTIEAGNLHLMLIHLPGHEEATLPGSAGVARIGN